MFWLIPAIGAILGAGLGAASTYHQGKKEQEALEQQKKSAWQQYVYGKEYSDNVFNLQKNEALDQLNTQRQNLNTQVDLSVTDFNSALLNQAFGIQDARIQTSSAIGESLAAEGASGTRGNAANEMIRSYAAQGLERNIEMQETQNSNYLNQLATSAGMSINAINSEEASWQPGGYKTQAKNMQDDYNLNLANLGQSNYEWQMEYSKPGALDYITNIFQGAASGFGMAAGIESWSKTVDWKNPWGSVGKKKNNSSITNQLNSALSGVSL